MALFSMHNPLVFTLGILGNLVSFMVFLAPVPTFYRVYKKKSTEGFHSVPYVIALFSSMVWIYYAWVKSNEFLLITINSVGCITESIYVAIYIVYAHKKARILTLKLLLLLNFGGFGLILILSHFLTNRSKRVQVLGWITVSVSTSVFIAPLSIMKQVIRTKSVEFMPISLSFFLILTAVIWFFYGLLLKDVYIAVIPPSNYRNMCVHRIKNGILSLRKLLNEFSSLKTQVLTR
ncbi:bidirectional sugar transporter SWEET14-like [Olea europaea subsp. europaea]|uniref:Bidirectional sugar transporter SWEET n=1 Tax=Olea europaea subsp. europaea TaxID=158383 RepID=A0A8S0TXS9_OLEEU|nr:bidirectional sugar transporter SWEET14-like [Olea europaea subsp. europaea]